MSEKVIGQQWISHDCLVCGNDNPLSLHSQYYNLENGDVLGIFFPKPEHQSYPGRVHGGVITAIIDETIGRAVQNRWPDVWGVTATIDVKFRKPVPYDCEVRCIGRITKHSTRMFTGEAKLYLPDGTLCAEGHAVYVNVPVDKISEGVDVEGVMIDDTRDWPAEVQIPEGAKLSEPDHS